MTLNSFKYYVKIAKVARRYWASQITLRQAKEEFGEIVDNARLIKIGK
jgi:hypothetical protein